MVRPTPTPIPPVGGNTGGIVDQTNNVGTPTPCAVVPAAPATPDPCAQIASLAANSNFIQMFQNLKTTLGNGTEGAYTFIINADGTINANYSQGATGASSVTPSFPAPEDGENHAHNLGDYPTFSPADIQQLYNVMQGGLMKNPSTFSDGLITAVGTSYLIKITNLTQFKAFGAANFGTNASYTAFENLYSKSQAQYFSGSSTAISSYELGLLQTLNNSGLTLFRGNSTFNNWIPITNQNNQVTNTPCATLFPSK